MNTPLSLNSTPRRSMLAEVLFGANMIAFGTATGFWAQVAVSMTVFHVIAQWRTRIVQDREQDLRAQAVALATVAGLGAQRIRSGYEVQDLMQRRMSAHIPA